MYKEIEIHDFKSLKRVFVNPSLITVFVGPNSSGKSSVLQALTLLKQSAGYDTLQTGGPIINLGKCEDLISKGSNTMTLGISGDLPVEEPLEFLGDFGFRYKISWKFGAEGRLIAVSAGIGSQFVNLAGSWTEREPQVTRTMMIEDCKFDYVVLQNVSRPIVLKNSEVSGKRASIGRDLRKIIGIVHRQLDLTFVVPPFRGQDLPWYSPKGSPQLQLTSTEGSVEQASRLASTVAYRRELESKISSWIEKITEVRVSSELVPGPQVTIMAHPKKPKIKVNIVNEGYGSNQLAHLMGQIALAPEGSSICIDDPEIHLHPKAQAELAELFVEIAKDERKQLVMTTHSEHMLFRFLTTVAEKKLDPSQLAIYYFDKKNGWTDARKLTVDDRGTLEEGLPGFFEADIGEFRKYIEAVSRKQK